MNTSLLASIKWVITKYGESILGDPVQLKKIFANYTKNEPKEERVAFGRCIEMGCYIEMKKAKNIDERSRIKANLTYKLQSSTGINIYFCRDALDILDAAIFGNVSPVLPVTSSSQSSSVQQRQIQTSPKPGINIWKKPELKWFGFALAAVLLIFLVSGFALKNVTQPQKDITHPQEDILNDMAGNEIDESLNESLIEKLQNDLLMEILTIKRAGRRDISGRIKVLVFPTNYKGNLFRMRLDSLTASVQEGIQIIQEQAKKYNQNVSIDFDVVTLNNRSYISINHYMEGLRQYPRHRSKHKNYNHVVLVHAIDMVERSYIITESLRINEEHIIMWFRDRDGFSAGTLAHEIFHAFGAEDLYYEQGVVPQEVENNFKTLLGNSIMINSHKYSNLDPINAWLIGWNKNPEPWYAWFIDKRDNSVE